MVLKITDSNSNSFRPIISNSLKINHSLNESKKETIQFDISNIGKLLSDLKKDESNLSIKQINSKMIINWESVKTNKEELNFYGEYSYEKKSFYSEFNYNFSVELDGKIKKYQMNMIIEVKDKSSISKKTNIVKEDILNFVNRIANKVMELAKSKKYDLKNIELDDEDLEEIIKYQDSRGRNVLLTLFNLIIELAQMQNYSNKKEKNATAIIFKPERQKNLEKEIIINSDNFNKFTLNIKELT